MIPNRGKGGDTVISLLKRISSRKFRHHGDVAVLMAGLNDVFVNVSSHYSAIKLILRQPWAETSEQFRKAYESVLDILSAEYKKVICVSITVMGEDLNSRFNIHINEYNSVIRDLCRKKSITYIDAYKEFSRYLSDAEQSPYLPKSAVRVLFDGLFIKSDHAVFRRSEKRGLKLTLDGAHLNPKGAEILAALIESESTEN